MSSRAERHGQILDQLVALLGREHAITCALLVAPMLVQSLDQSRGTVWRTRADSSLALVPSDDDVADLYDAAIAAVGRQRAVALMSLLDGRAARALDRRRGRLWRERPSA
jgi:hypothetical protein